MKKKLNRGERARRRGEARARRREAAALANAEAERAHARWAAELRERIQREKSSPMTAGLSFKGELVAVRINGGPSSATVLHAPAVGVGGPSAEQGVGRARQRASGWFDALGAVVPRRLRMEELGDAQEYVTTLGRSAWQIYMKVATTAFWVVVNAIRELRSAFGGKKSAD